MNIYFMETVLLVFLGLILLSTFINKLIKKTRKIELLSYVVIIILGLATRLYLAASSKGNFDMHSYQIVSDLVLEGKNVYFNTVRYNYSPIWFLLLAFFKSASGFINLSFPFLIRTFLSLVDLASLFLMFRLTKLLKKDFFIIAAAFFLNPISILLTGHHGQFENLTSFFVLLGIYLYLKKAQRWKSVLSFFLAGFVKHSSYNQVLAGLNHLYKSKVKVLLLFLLSLFLFLLMFVPYLGAKEQIIKQVFLYKGYEGVYGPGYFISLWRPVKDFAPFMVYPFILSYFLFALFFKARHVLRTSLINSLFFLSFTSGVGDQYFVLPVAIGAIIGGRWFFVYTFIVSLFLFGASAELNLIKYRFITHTIVWLVTFTWFVLQLLKAKQKSI